MFRLEHKTMNVCQRNAARFKFGQTYSTGKQVAEAFVVSSYYFFNLYAKVQLVRCDIFTAIIYLYWVEEFLLRKITQQRVFQLLEKTVDKKAAAKL